MFNRKAGVDKASLRTSVQIVTVINCSVCTVIGSVSKSDSTRPLIFFPPSFDHLPLCLCVCVRNLHNVSVLMLSLIKVT